MILSKRMQRLPKTMPTRSRKYCSVPQCNTYCTIDFSLHSFPLNNPKLCNRWKTVLKIGKPITKNMRVCSQHFLPEDFMIITPFTKLKRLKKIAIPSQHVPNDSLEISKKEIHPIEQKWLMEIREDDDVENTSTNVLQTLIIHNPVNANAETMKPKLMIKIEDNKTCAVTYSHFNKYEQEPKLPIKIKSEIKVEDDTEDVFSHQKDIKLIGISNNMW